MATATAVTILQLVYARNAVDNHPIEHVFNSKEQMVLQKINAKMQGKTPKQQNPFSQNQVSWATWVIARLGGWKGYASQKPPGPITIFKGLQRFYLFRDAFELFINDE